MDLSPSVQEALALFVRVLNEKQRRLFAGLESLLKGPGSDHHVAQWLGMAPQTVARGREQLLSQDVDLQRLRRVGAGRPRVEKKRPK